MVRYYVFITLIIHVKLEASIASLLANIKENNGVAIIDHDEVARRLILRAPLREAAYLQMLVDHYADTATFEVKASMKKRIDVKKLRSMNTIYRSIGNRLLFYKTCSSGAVFGEARGRDLLLKYCKKAMMVDPAALPPVLCSFDALMEGIAEVADRARGCFDEIINSLLK